MADGRAPDGTPAPGPEGHRGPGGVSGQFYGEGFVNDVIREALRPGDDVLVVSKVGAVSDPGGPFPLRLAQRPEDLRASVEADLAALRTERIPVVNLRRVDSGITIPVPDDQVIPSTTSSRRRSPCATRARSARSG